MQIGSQTQKATGYFEGSFGFIASVRWLFGLTAGTALFRHLVTRNKKVNKKNSSAAIEHEAEGGRGKTAPINANWMDHQGERWGFAPIF
jgi:hypothetical protein